MVGAMEPAPVWRSLKSPEWKDFAGLSFQYADSCREHAQTDASHPSIVSMIKIKWAGFTEMMDT